VFATGQNGVRVSVCKRWNDNSAGAVDNLVTVKVVRGNLATFNGKAVRKTKTCA
jgi:hypothetical protein